MLCTYVNTHFQSGFFIFTISSTSSKGAMSAFCLKTKVKWSNTNHYWINLFYCLTISDISSCINILRHPSISTYSAVSNARVKLNLRFFGSRVEKSKASGKKWWMRAQKAMPLFQLEEKLVTSTPWW